MKTTVKISLNGMALTLDEDAYLILDEYIKSLSNYFQDKEDGKETIKDIEARIAELLQIRLIDSSRVINIIDIEEVINIMGKPNDFYEKEEETLPKQPQTEAVNKETKFSKKLYRDKEHSIIGGVCAGFGHYFNFDPVFIRIGFVIGFLLTFWAPIPHRYSFWIVLLYLILWIVIPKAKTLNERLAMRGTNPSISNIEEEGVRPIIRPRSNTLVNVIKVFAGVILGLIGLAALITIISGIALSFGFLQHLNIPPLWDIVSTFGFDSISMKIAFLLCMLLPLIGCLYLCVKLLFQLRFTKVDLFVSVIAFLTLVGAGFYLGGSIIGFFKKYEYSSSSTKEIPFETSSQNVYVNLADELLGVKRFWDSDDIFLVDDKTGKKSFFVSPRVVVYKDTVQNYKLELKRNAWAENYDVAYTKAQEADLPLSINDSLITIFPHVYNASNKFTFIGYDLIITAPQNKNIIIGQGLKEIRYY